jgi:hypothetical protein
MFCGSNANLARTAPQDVSSIVFMGQVPAESAHFGALEGRYALDIIVHHPIQYARDTYFDVMLCWRAPPSFFNAPYSRAAWWISAVILLSDVEQGTFPFLPLAMLVFLAMEIVIAAALGRNAYTRFRFPEDWIMILASTLLIVEALAMASGRAPRLFSSTHTA